MTVSSTTTGDRDWHTLYNDTSLTLLKTFVYVLVLLQCAANRRARMRTEPAQIAL